MTKLTWDERPLEFGLDRGVYYMPGGVGEVWNGLTDVKESPSGVDPLTSQIDGVRIYRRSRSDDFAGSITAVTCPDSFFDNVLTQTRRRNFGLSYRIQTESSHKIHLVYNILLSQEEIAHTQKEVDPFSWNFTTTPLPIPGMRSSAHLVIDAGLAISSAIEEIEAVLYGDESSDARLPSPLEVADIFEAHATLRITDNGDGTWTATGPDQAIHMLDDTTFEINWPSVEYIDADTYTVRSW